MIFGKTKLELKVGIFVFMGLVILAVAVLSIGGFKTWTSGYEVNFIFNFVNGVKIGFNSYRNCSIVSVIGPLAKPFIN